MKNYTFDIGGTGIKCIVFEDLNEISLHHLDTRNVENTKDMPTKVKFIDVLDKISEILQNEKDDFNLAIAVPGPVDASKKRVLADSSLTDINIDLVSYFSKFSNLKKFVIQNDAKAAAYGEFSERKKYMKIQNIAHLTIGTAIGCGLIINNEIFNGKNNRAGEVGKMRSNIYGNDGLTVTMETGLGTLLLKHKYITNGEVLLTGFELFENYNAGEPLIRKMVDEWIEQLSKFIINLDYILDFDLITLGGAVSSNEQFVQMLNKSIDENKVFKWQGQVLETNNEILEKFQISNLKNKAACYGGLYLLKNH
ncbi:ROK family protein [Mesoplasma florum]|uniref:ROK family protein n=1 Tax=Mesoplasma florum TaxID=2151 RepID=UPI000D089529|nr:ROK family protein [Mesoplasma florum]AVN60693.1 hypothetical protein CG005_00050 [Mesoplasma florum]